MPQPSRFRYTISQWMVLVAGVAVALGLSRFTASLGIQLVLILFANVMLAALSVVTLSRLGESLFGIQCPACGRWTLHRIARYRRYYRCSICRARLKRIWLGPWTDASSPEEDVYFRGKVEARVWRGYDVPVDPGETTSGQLLRSKRNRATHDPEEP